MDNIELHFCYLRSTFLDFYSGCILTLEHHNNGCYSNHKDTFLLSKSPPRSNILHNPHGDSVIDLDSSSDHILEILRDDDCYSLNNHQHNNFENNRSIHGGSYCVKDEGVTKHLSSLANLAAVVGTHCNYGDNHNFVYGHYYSYPSLVSYTADWAVN